MTSSNEISYHRQINTSQDLKYYNIYPVKKKFLFIIIFFHLILLFIVKSTIPQYVAHVMLI
jgi:hypothetical protein